ncbi:hypothetical protein J6Z48_00820 [bacterium]|nr:hypothetical protein [bacterium]
MPPRPGGPRGPRRPKRGSIMDGIYTFIYGVHRRGRNKPFPRGKYEGYSGALAEIGTQPMVFPINQSMKVIDDSINGAVASKVPYSKNKSMKIGVASPRNIFMLNRAMMPRPTDAWIRIGGNLHYDSDGALIGLYAKRNGADSDVANDLGHLYRDIYNYDVRIASKQYMFNYSVRKADNVFQLSEDADEMEYYEKGNQFRSRATTIFAKTLVKNIPSMSGRATEKGIKEFLDNMQTVENKHERITRTYRYFCDTCGLTEETSNALAQNLWGYQGRNSILDGDKYDLGCYRYSEELLREEERKKQEEINRKKDVITEAMRRQQEADHLKEMFERSDSTTDILNQSDTYGFGITRGEFEDMEKKAVNQGLVDMMKSAANGDVTSRDSILNDPHAFANLFVLEPGETLEESDIINFFSNPSVTENDVDTFISGKNINHANYEDSLNDALDRHNIYHLDEATGNALLNSLDGEASAKIVGRTDRDIALNLINMSIAVQQMSHAGSRITDDTLHTAIDGVNSYVTNNTSKGRGLRRERALLAFRYLTTANILSSPDFLWGKWENFGKLDESLQGGINFCKVVEDANVQGDKSAKYVKPANSIIGHLIGGLYYWHPANMVKGLWNGSLFYSLAHGKKSSPFYVLGKANINNVFSGYSKFRGNVVSGITSMVAPPLRFLSKSIKSLVGKIIGTTGFAGIIASLIIDKFQNEIDALIGKIVGLVFYGLLCIIVLIFAAGSRLISNQVTMYLDKEYNKNVVLEEDNKTFDETDLGIDLIN